MTVASRTPTRSVACATVALSDFFIDVLLLGLFVMAFAFVFTAAFSTIVILDDEGRTKAGVISVTVITVPVVGSRVMGRVHTKGGLVRHL